MDKCVICEEDILFNDGRNPWPLGEGDLAEEGECCSFCDEMYVLPARLEMQSRRR